MPLIVEYSKRFGVYDDLLPVLAMSLGAGETTLAKMAAGYASFVNGGKQVKYTLIDRIQDRWGKTIWRYDGQRACPECNADRWEGQLEPTLPPDERRQIIDAFTAYQITSMMEGVVQRGTGTYAKRLGRPVAGKTGTSSDYKDAWFIGFTPELAVGVYIGYDRPRNMGSQATGGGLAVPIFTAFMENALKGTPPTPFNMPPGMTKIWIDSSSGVKALAGQSAIAEAFKPGTGPNLITSVIGVDSNAFMSIEDGQDSDLNAGRGGLF
jgi:penicillin-binding protein 1A